MDRVIGGWYDGKEVNWPAMPYYKVRHPSAGILRIGRVQEYRRVHDRWHFVNEKELLPHLKVTHD